MSVGLELWLWRKEGRGERLAKEIWKRREGERKKIRESERKKVKKVTDILSKSNK